MLNNISINIRILMLIIIPTIVFIAIGFFALDGIGKDHKALEQSDYNFKSSIAATDLAYTVNKEYALLISGLGSGVIYWNAGKGLVEQAIEEIEEKTKAFEESLSAEEKKSDLAQRILFGSKRVVTSYNKIKPLFLLEATDPTSETTMASEILSKRARDVVDGIESKSTKEVVNNRDMLNFYIYSEMYYLFNPLTSDLKKIITQKYFVSSKEGAQAIEDSSLVSTQVLVGVFGGILAIMIIGNFISSSITSPTRSLSGVVKRLTEGEYDARVPVKGSDEFFHLGTAFNKLLDDRAVTLDTIDAEHQELNQSVFSLLQAVAELSERDLTIRANVTEDATGPVADALNLLAEETAETLSKVKEIAFEVNETSQNVNTHLMSVNKLAMKEQERAIETADQMNKMLQRLDSISNSAADTNIMADNTTQSTKKAHESVTDTLSGMSVIRDTVQETGKRIKQLGERSQEISHVIEIIDTIAERTTLLALNASMQAVAAGDEGKGFSVIAEEIQRLAESSRESTGQISTLVRNIQQETNTTIATMDKTIEQVIDGSTKAEDAAEQMQKVLETTNELVNAVDQIAVASKDQVGISEGLKHKAEGILKSTQVTGQELLSLTGLSRNMSDYAQQLVTSVNVFTLGDEKSTEEAEETVVAEQVAAEA